MVEYGTVWVSMGAYVLRIHHELQNGVENMVEDCGFLHWSTAKKILGIKNISTNVIRLQD